MMPDLKNWSANWIKPQVSPTLEAFLNRRRGSLPVLWLMGRTGAGKSSIIQRLTGDSRAAIGNGYEPCTSGSAYYDYPQSMPVMRFLDTRGLGEQDYQPEQDLSLARQGSHALLIVTRLDDTSQFELCEALKAMDLDEGELAILQIHTAQHAVENDQLDSAREHNERLIHDALGFSVDSLMVDFTDPIDGFSDPDLGLPGLRQALIDMVPELSRVLVSTQAQNEEERVFQSLRHEVIGYCSAAAAVDLFPGLGLVAVPTIQGKMLHTLAGRYASPWDRRTATEFVATLGSSFLYRYLWSLAGRQAAKLVPGYGQTAAAAAAATISFASTYALARAAGLYLYKKLHQEELDPESIRQAFRDAFEQQRQ